MSYVTVMPVSVLELMKKRTLIQNFVSQNGPTDLWSEILLTVTLFPSSKGFGPRITICKQF